MLGQSAIAGMGCAEIGAYLTQLSSERRVTPQEIAAFKAIVAASVGGAVAITTSDLVGIIPLALGVVRYLQQAKLLSPEFSNLISTAQMLGVMNGHMPQAPVDVV